MWFILLISWFGSAACVSYQARAWVFHIFEKEVSGTSCTLKVQERGKYIEISVRVDSFKSGNRFIDQRVTGLLSDSDHPSVVISIDRKKNHAFERDKKLYALATVKSETLPIEFEVIKKEDRYLLKGQSSYNQLGLNVKDLSPSWLIVSIDDVFYLSGWIDVAMAKRYRLDSPM